MSINKQIGLKRRLQEATPQERTEILNKVGYEVGFGKPPEATRFRPGESGNRRGRPKGTENFRTILAEEMSAVVEVNEGGKRRNVSKQRVATRQLANKAATGDLKAFALLVEMLRKTGQLASEPPAEVPALDERDLRALDRFAALFTGAQVIESEDHDGSARASNGDEANEGSSEMSSQAHPLNEDLKQ
jgi:hypothetical protein